MDELNLFAVLEELDKNNFSLYDELSEDAILSKDLDKLLDYMLPLWMAGAQNDVYHRRLIKGFDSIANIGWFNNRGKNELRTKMLAAIGLGKSIKHKFLNNAARESSSIFDVFAKVYPDIRTEDVRMLVGKMDEKEFKRFLTEHGYQDDEAKLLLKSFKNYKKECC